MDISVLKNGKILRCGITTGTCATAATKAALIRLLTGEGLDSVYVMTPAGIGVDVPIEYSSIEDNEDNDNFVTCAVKKDAGDDPDITDGILVYATVSKIASGVEITGGKGVGKVTQKGLDQPVGESAINSVPRQMITEAVNEVSENNGYDGGIKVVISVPDGEMIAKKTFNPRLGIEGGISIIGTSGIVEPMSNKALTDTIKVEQNILVNKEKEYKDTLDMLITPGNYGQAFASKTLGLRLDEHISSSNFIGDTISQAVELGFKRMLLVSHIGKIVKLGIGITNTHSSFGDGRMETLIACALKAGADIQVLNEIEKCVMTDAALAIINNAGILEETMKILGEKINQTLLRQVPEDVEIGFICFTNDESLDLQDGILCQSDNAGELMSIWR